jgi:hypothetical protein
MAQNIEIVVSAVGFDNVAKGAAVVTKSLATTAVEAQKLDSKLQTLGKGTAQATQSLTNLGRVVQDAPFGFLGIANNINPLLESFQRLKAETGSTKTALKALGSSFVGAGGLGLAVSLVSSALIVFGDRLFASSKRADEAAESAKKYSEAVKGIFEGQGKEATQVLTLITVLKSETETRERKLVALKELNKINPEIFKGLKLEGDAVSGLDRVYQSYIENIKNVVAVKIIQLKLEEKLTKLLEIQGVGQTQQIKNLAALSKAINSRTANELRSGGNSVLANQLEALTTFSERTGAGKIATLNKEIEDLAKQLGEFSKAIKLNPANDGNSVIKRTKEQVDELKKSVLELNRVITQDFLDLFYGNKQNPSASKVVTIPAKLDIQIENPETLFNNLLNPARNSLQQIVDFSLAVGEIIRESFSNVLISIGEGFGSLLSGGSIGNFFAGIFEQIGAALQQLGKYFITTANLIKTIRAALIKNPVLAIAAGISLIAIGKLISNASKKQAFAVGTRFAPGGLSLVGERGPELISVPRGAQITPSAQTANIFGGLQSVEVYGMVRGNDIYFSNRRTAQTIGRNT